MTGHDDKRLLMQAGMSWPFLCQKFFDAAIDAVLPSKCLPEYLPNPTEYDAVNVIAFGKAAADMAAVVENQWAGIEMSGVVICPYGKGNSSSIFDVIEASHPLPDQNSVKAANIALRIAESTGPGDLLLILVSGGGSALMAKPVEGVSLEQKRQIIEHLLHVGATIDEINLIRRSLSAVKGGKLLEAAQFAKKVITLAISDVVNDDPSIIASGPSVSPSVVELDFADKLLQKYKAPLHKGLVVPSPAKFSTMPNHSYRVIAGGQHAIAAADAFLVRSGCAVINWGHQIEGEARIVAANHAEVILEYGRVNKSGRQPVAFLSGGELTVTVTGGGLGGPNQEYILALIEALPKGEYYAFAADTDGLDGKGGASGAFFTPEMYDHAIESILDIKSYLNNNDSYNFFNNLNALFKVKNDVLNVNDLRLVIWLPDYMR